MEDLCKIIFGRKSSGNFILKYVRKFFYLWKTGAGSSRERFLIYRRFGEGSPLKVFYLWKVFFIEVHWQLFTLQETSVWYFEFNWRLVESLCRIFHIYGNLWNRLSSDNTWKLLYVEALWKIFCLRKTCGRYFEIISMMACVRFPLCGRTVGPVYRDLWEVYCS